MVLYLKKIKYPWLGPLNNQQFDNNTYSGMSSAQLLTYMFGSFDFLFPQTGRVQSAHEPNLRNAAMSRVAWENPP